MQEKIPKIYENKPSKNFNNNKKIYYSRLNEKREEKPEVQNIEESVRKSIYKLFNSPNFVYKIKTEIIKTNGEHVEKEVIALVNDYLITMDEEKMPLSSIKSIKEKTT